MKVGDVYLRIFGNPFKAAKKKFLTVDKQMFSLYNEKRISWSKITLFGCLGRRLLSGYLGPAIPAADGWLFGGAVCVYFLPVCSRRGVFCS